MSKYEIQLQQGLWMDYVGIEIIVAECQHSYLPTHGLTVCGPTAGVLNARCGTWAGGVDWATRATPLFWFEFTILKK